MPLLGDIPGLTLKFPFRAERRLSKTYATEEVSVGRTGLEGCYGNASLPRISIPAPVFQIIRK